MPTETALDNHPVGPSCRLPPGAPAAAGPVTCWRAHFADDGRWKLFATPAGGPLPWEDSNRLLNRRYPSSWQSTVIDRAGQIRRCHSTTKPPSNRARHGRVQGHAAAHRAARIETRTRLVSSTANEFPEVRHDVASQRSSPPDPRGKNEKTCYEQSSAVLRALARLGRPHRTLPSPKVWAWWGAPPKHVRAEAELPDVCRAAEDSCHSTRMANSRSSNSLPV